MYSLADQNGIHCTTLAFFDGKLGKFLLIKFLELSFNFFFFFCIFKVKVDLTQTRIVISFSLKFENLITRNPPSLPSRKVNSTQWPRFRSARDIYKPVHLF